MPDPAAVVVPAPPAPPASPWACRCSETDPYRCPVCEVRWLEAELAISKALHRDAIRKGDEGWGRMLKQRNAAQAELAAIKATLPGINVRHLLTEETS